MYDELILQNLTTEEVRKLQAQMRLTPWTLEECAANHARPRPDVLARFYSDWSNRIGIHPALLRDRVAPYWPGRLKAPTEFARQLRGQQRMEPLLVRLTLMRLGTTPEELFGNGLPTPHFLSEFNSAARQTVQLLVTPDDTNAAADLLQMSGVFAEAVKLVRIAQSISESHDAGRAGARLLLSRWQSLLTQEQTFAARLLQTARISPQTVQAAARRAGAA